MILTDFGDLIAERMRNEHRALAARWFERLLDLVPVEAREVFPTESLLDHIPALILEISAYVRDPEDSAIAANTAILEKARELGSLRHRQRASLHQVLREYHLLGGVLVSFVLEEMERLGTMPPASISVAVVFRLHQAVNVLTQSTVEAFVALYTQTIAEQNQRLEQFTRMAAHEWRQPLSALQFGVSLLRRADLDGEHAARTLAAVERNVGRLVDLTNKLETVARMQTTADSPTVQEVSSTTVIQEAARQLREMADARGVQIRIAENLPTLTVDVGRLELAFVNLLSNAIKYSDPGKSVRLVDVTGTLISPGACRLEIRDNGLGIPDHALAAIFQRFTRAHADRADLPDVPGIGLGLSIVEDCVAAMGGQIIVRSAEGEGTVFVITLPTAPLPSAPA
jgi:signal transduction histidine kinase